MASNDPPSPTPGPIGDPEPTSEDALRRLEQRLDRASEAAERLIAEAAVRATRSFGGAVGGEGAAPAGDAVDREGAVDAEDAVDREGAVDAEASGGAERELPPAGWQIPGAGANGAERNFGPGGQGEVDLLMHVLSSLRDRIPPELQRRLGDALREVLLALRALIDWYLERSERRRAEPVEVQDIPIM